MLKQTEGFHSEFPPQTTESGVQYSSLIQLQLKLKNCCSFTTYQCVFFLGQKTPQKKRRETINVMQNIKMAVQHTMLTSGRAPVQPQHAQTPDKLVQAV